MKTYKITKDGLSFSFQDEDSCFQVESCFEYLKSEIGSIDKFHDRVLFFQNNRIIDNWLMLVKTIGNNDLWAPTQDDIQSMQRENTRLMFLCTHLRFITAYRTLCDNYINQLRIIIEEHESSLIGNCISSDAIQTLSDGNYGQDLDVGDVTQYLQELNKTSAIARHASYDTIYAIHCVLLAIVNRGLDIVYSHRPTLEDLAEAFNKDMKGDTHAAGDRILRDMKEDLNRHYKARRTDPYTPELWGELLNADEEALIMASKGKLLECDDVKQEHWDKRKRKKMTENGELMRLIVEMCSTDELFDFAKAESEHQFVSLLTEDNLALFSEIIIRRHLIQCKMNPKLKAIHDKWLNSSEEEKEEEVEEKSLSHARLSKLDEMIKILQNCKWKRPATAENIEQLLDTVFGRDTSSMDDGDIPLVEKMWALVESGSGERMTIVPANLAGFFSEENLLTGSPSEISHDLFGNVMHINNINKGHSSRCSKAFSEVIPFLRKYIDKTIRQE